MGRATIILTDEGDNVGLHFELDRPFEEVNGELTASPACVIGVMTRDFIDFAMQKLGAERGETVETIEPSVGHDKSFSQN